MKKITKKQVKLAVQILWWAMVILLVLLLIWVLGAKFRGEVPEIFGYSILWIVSGSMEPQIPTGSYILVKSCPPQEVEVGDVISFYSEERAIYGLPNTHRVQQIISTDEGIEFVTRGDANVVDDVVNAKEERLIGVYLGEIALLTWFAGMLNGKGIFALLIVMQVAMAGMFVYSALKKGKDEDDTPQANE